MDTAKIVKICEALSGETRANILEYIYKNTHGTSVDELSRRFNLHPNVIRTHLDKLQEIGLIKSYDEKKGRGRPKKIYKKGNKRFIIQYPKRRYELLSSLLLEIIIESHIDETIITKVGEDFGKKIMRRYMLDEQNKEGGLKTLWNAVSKIFGEWGLMPELIKLDNESIEWDAKNCIYFEQAMKHSDITCTLHKAVIQGMLKEIGLDHTAEIPKKFPDGYEGCYVKIKK